LPIFDGFIRANKLRIAQSELRSSESELANSRNAVVREVWKAYTDLKTALRKQESAAKLLSAAESAFDASLEAYRNGLGTYRCIAHDRRGHGRSSQPWQGNDMDTYADDLAALVEELDLTDAIHVGHSTGGGEVARYIARHGTNRVAKTVLIGAVPPLMLKTAANPGGLLMDVFDQLRAGVLADRSQFFKDLTMPFYGYNRSSAKVSEGVRNSFWLQGMMVGFPASYFCIKAFSETDQTEDLKKMDVPTLILHGDDDQIVPIDNAGKLQAKLVKNAMLKIYKGAPHGMCTTHKDKVNADLLEFIKS
jgi:non-heme chloroperoxidase